jgi:hypothetical protein
VEARAARIYWRVSALVFAIWAGLGFFLVAQNRAALVGNALVADTPMNALHAALALVALACALPWTPSRFVLATARAASIFLLALAVLGFVSGRLFGLGPLAGTHLEIGENALHLALGAWGAYAAFGPAPD